MAYLSIAVLGSPLICYGEQEIRFSTRKQLALEGYTFTSVRSEISVISWLKGDQRKDAFHLYRLGNNARYRWKVLFL